MKQQQLTLITELQEINRAAADYMCMDNIVLIFVYKNYTSYLRLKGYFPSVVSEMVLSIFLAIDIEFEILVLWQP